MRNLRAWHDFAPWLSALLLAGCQASGSIPSGSGPSGSGGASSAGGGSGVGGAPVVSDSPLLPARIRRLSNAELDSSARTVVGISDPVTGDFAPDARQSGYTVNDAQRVDSVLVKQIAAAATKLAATVRSKASELAPCADPVAGQEACAQAFIASFATRAYRRPLSAEESAKLLALYHAGADGATYADGVELVASGVLQSAGFLYLTELGATPGSADVTLTPYETASQLSYLVTGNPPDAPLLSAAASAQLATPEQRSAQFSRLLTAGDAGGSRGRVTRVVKEWLGIDRLVDTSKDTTKYGEFAALKTAMIGETGDFVQRLLESKSGTVGELLGATWTVTSDQKLRDLYGGTSGADNEIALPTRRGILNQAAFLSVYAHANETAPVLRGVTVLRRVVCELVASPASLMLTVPPLALDPNKSMRQRMNDHVVNAACASCHKSIDSFGFSFELYDGMGASQPDDHGPIDSSTTVAIGKDYDGTYASSDELALALSKSAAVRECFARNVFRATAGRSDVSVQGSEQAFIDYWRTAQKPAGDSAVPQSATAFEGSILETLRAFVTSPNFTQRRAQ